MSTSSSPRAPKPIPRVDPAEAPLAEAVQYVLDRFHVFQREELGRLPALFRKVVATRAELAPAMRVFEELASELDGHFDKKEQILLPYIVSLDPSRRGRGFQAPFGSVEGPVQVMHMEHLAAQEAMARVRELTSDLNPPADATADHRALFEGLRVFIDDVNAHIAYEEVLFPRAVEVENAG